MTGYTDTQLNVWLRGLLAIAWADGDFTAAERVTIIDLTQTELDVVNIQKIDPLLPVREWLDGLEIHDPRLARLLCKFIPAQCPFERDLMLFGHKIVHIPPMCKLNPLYDQTVGLRFRALSYLADECGEDVSAYCS
jgi:Mo-dependent nitrogenase C-terminus